ncbi:lysine-2,3-aminomutase-like protein [Filomicrobium sp.]|uniref:lysine-2,3-aminomutase-like protein n=1 Tax=Filomicrobium sp. TaxID=2024831 RepID=UPI002584B2F3|nr:lysine-2,3-aminomutase-like protein [Filomicrobium sp.]MCV0371396.1 lysine-2,3-aminomutase-like protein [Filomicrobium sp.]
MSTTDQPIKTVGQLIVAGLTPPDQHDDLERLTQHYALAITPTIATLIDPTAGHKDPIAAQFVPSMPELDRHPEEQDDPIGDDTYAPIKGIVHRYADRCLLKPVSVCPVYCRFCFRRETIGPGHNGQLTSSELEKAIGYIAQHPEIWEVILTGGDPLVLPPRRVREITQRLTGIPHVRVIRWHSRVPVVDPDRIDTAMVQALRSPEKSVYIALHANHPRELTNTARAACASLIDAGVVMISQSVLLKGVNDDADTLETLMRTFVEMRIKPYYLHHPDLAPGTTHFRLPIARGQEIVGELRQRLSGLAMPTYILDIPGGYGKVPIGPGYIRGNGQDQSYEITDRKGRTHQYRDCCAAPEDD